MLADILPYLRCPHCDQELTADRTGRALHCSAGHSFDLARQGYAPLSRAPIRHPGDSATMVAARERFLATGAYQFLANALAAAATTAPTAVGPADGEPELVVEVGAGTGYYLARVLDARPTAVGLALDSAKPALRRAARCHPRAGAVLADAWQRLPVADHSATLLLNVFAPRHGAEFARVLTEQGRLLVVSPGPDHLTELVDRLGDAAGVRLLGVAAEKPAQLSAALGPWFHPIGEELHTRRLRLTRSQVAALVAMGPSGAHTEPAALEQAVARLPDPLQITASVRLSRYAPR
ncbi:23S rRNA methyltransferase [Natronosporangium hydrolyticum]|uniref:23S rRNA methyltransferase n=1 Tax=Natronosporangium hydrolyticum TaxID=2811111 RepID=A0A895YJD4_9ACTN|nr:23S rRNA methyltransferase [Natronosporangium hydrolyticum]QSB15473.1 23S rRNA methyltransferase [Natronosporangium hydrolyticum]